MFWDRYYQDGTLPWDLGGPPPRLVTHLRGLSGSPRRVLCPGAGRGHDAIAWAKAGHEVTAVDFSPRAVEQARALAASEGVAIEVLQADVLDLPEALRGRFALVWEHTCLCALEPDQREAYVASMAGALEAGGQLHALLWDLGREGGPPFGITPREARDRLASWFAIESLEPVEVSAAERTGEFFVVARRRAD